MPQLADAVVVGAGPNGLVAANLLADAGWDVVVLEAQPEPGGAVRSAPDVPAAGYVADLFSAFYPLAAASPVLARLDLESYGLAWTHAPAVLAHVFDDGPAAVLSRDIDQTVASVEAFRAGDGDAWVRWYERWRDLEPTLLRALLGPFPPLRAGASLARTVGLREGLRLARLAALPVRRLVAEELPGPGASMLVAGNALHTDLSPDSAGSAVFGLLLAMLGQEHGFPVPVGGAGRLTDALVARLAARGGTLRCSAPVASVVLDDVCARGVLLADGEPVLARHAVLADVPAPVLYDSLVGTARLPGRLRADLERFQWDSSTVKLNWALSGPVPWRDPGVSRAGTVHLGGDLDDLGRYSLDLATRTVPRRPFVLAGQMTTADPSRSPARTEAVWAYAHLPHGVPDRAAVEAYAQRMEDELERAAPGFRDLVVGRLLQGPADLEHDDAGLVHGALNGGTAAIHQQLVFRPTPGLGRPDTFVPGLFLASSSAHPGGGVHGACGSNAARAALRRASVGARLYDATVTAAQRRLQT
jgi:phytoene dehydrogenase-like protein